MDLRNSTDQRAFGLLNGAATQLPNDTPYVVIVVVDGQPFMVSNIAPSHHEKILCELLEKLRRAPTVRTLAEGKS